jgi:glutamyl-tRNA reductase
MNDWAEQVRSAELNRALKEIRAGKDANVVMESMSKRLNAKLLHPLLKEISNVEPSFNIEESRKNYNKIMRING